MANYKPLTDVKVDESGTYYIGEDAGGNWFRIPADNKGGSVRLIKKNTPSSGRPPIGESPETMLPLRSASVSDAANARHNMFGAASALIEKPSFESLSKTLRDSSSLFDEATDFVRGDTQDINDSMTLFQGLKDKVVGTGPSEAFPDALEEAIQKIGVLKNAVTENMRTVGMHAKNLMGDVFGNAPNLSSTGQSVAEGTEEVIQNTLGTPEGQGLIPDEYPAIGTWDKFLNLMGPGPKLPRR